MLIHQVKQVLDDLYTDFDYDRHILNDPIEFPYRYSDPKDMEVVAFISTAFAHGRVSLFKAVLEKIFAFLGSRPYDFLINASESSFDSLDVYYRQSNMNDVRAFLYALFITLKKYGSIKALFEKYYNDSHKDYIPALSSMVTEIYSSDLSYFYPDGKSSRGFVQLLSDPSKNSVCKRLNLFLRWMIRKGKPDLGLWDYPASKLLIPVDTHVSKLARYIGIAGDRASVDITFAREITAKLRDYDPDDPVRYDFSLCHVGISQGCPVPLSGSIDENICKPCRLAPICQKYNDRL